MTDDARLDQDNNEHGGDTALPYLERTLVINGQEFGQEHLLTLTGPIVVLGEPGAGKTQLFASVADRLGVEMQDARIFANKTAERADGAKYLLVDAMDEVSMIEGSGAIDKLLFASSAVGADTFMISTRSAHWNEARKIYTEKCFGEELTVVRILPLTHDQQEILFCYLLPGHDFNVFKNKIEKVGLDDLLGNPNLLKLVVRGYGRTDGEIESKTGVFASAIELLVAEHNEEKPHQALPSIERLVAIGDEVCAKALLAGAIGISNFENSSTREFPYRESLSCGECMEYLVNSGLFTSSSHGANFHELTHRTIVEFCAARYLAKSVQDPQSIFSLSRLLSLIAPNGFVREEFRGVLGWLTTQLTNNDSRKRIINIDPVSVFAAGDPPQLDDNSKVALLRALCRVSKEDPASFGAVDWYRMNVRGFFSPSVMTEAQEILEDPDTTSNLKSVLLRSMAGANLTSCINDSLLRLATNKEESRHVRSYALQTWEFEKITLEKTIEKILCENSEDALDIVLSSLGELRLKELGTNLLLLLANRFGEIYSADRDRYASLYVSNKIVLQNAIYGVLLESAIQMLGTITSELTCACEDEKAYRCDCRAGMSFVASMILDRVLRDEGFELDAKQVWSWIKPMRFSFTGGGRSEDESFLSENEEARRAIQLVALRENRTAKGMRDAVFHINHHGYRDLYFSLDDIHSILCVAFEEDDIALWETFYPGIDYRHQENINLLNRRRLMRGHAREKLDFMRAWYLLEHADKKNRMTITDGFTRKHRRFMRRCDRENVEEQKELQKEFDKHKKSIQEGKNIQWLVHLACHYFTGDNRTIEKLTLPSGEFIELSLRNSLQYLSDQVPSLEDEAKSSAEGKTPYVVIVAHAATLAEFIHTGTVKYIDKRILEVVKTQGSTSYGNRQEWSMLNRFQEELNGVLFNDEGSAEKYARAYVEGRLNVNAKHINTHWFLTEAPFERLRSILPLEWLGQYPGACSDVIKELFEIAISHSDPVAVRTIAEEARELIKSDVKHELRDYWYLMGFLLEDSLSAPSQSWLQENKERILLVQSHVDKNAGGEEYMECNLNAEKVEFLLDTFIGQWPQVELPDHWGTGDPPGHTAYRFIAKDLPWQLVKG